MNIDNMLEKAREISKNTGKPLFVIISDMIFCAVKFGSGYMDYYLFEMYNMNNSQRNTLVTRKRNNSLVHKYNNPEYMHLFDNKDEFNEIFQKYLCRNWISLNKNSKQKVIDFMTKTKKFMVKPTNTCCGKGIRKINLLSDNVSPENLYNTLISDKYNFILEEIITQHDDLNKLYSGSVNTARIVTLRKNNITRVICAFLRVGNGNFVDNFNSGGMVAPIDVNTGTIYANAVDKKKNVYKNHPITNTKFTGFRLPDWDKAKNLCISASDIIPQLGYIAWDVCFTPETPCLVEANEYPGYDLYQLPEHIPDKKGLWDKFLI